MMEITAHAISREVAAVCKEFSTIISVLAMGSCARDEETYFTNINGQKEMMSDFEMLIITSSNAETVEISEKLSKLREKLLEIRHSQSFDLEWSFKNVNQLKMLDKRFIFFETKAAGKIIYGENSILNHFPDINLHNLNYCELNTVIIHRLYHVARDLASKDEQYKKYLIARNSLDFATAFLPLAGILTATYTRRMAELEKIAEKYKIPDDLIHRQRNYLVMKKDYSSKLYNAYQFSDMLQDFYQDFQLLKYLQCQLQSGVLFRNGKRRLLSALYHGNIKSLKLYLQWQNSLNMLCDELFMTIACENVQEQDLTKIKTQMMELFGYC